MRYFGASLVALAVAACASAPTVPRQKLGEIEFRDSANPTDTPITFSVQTGRVFNPNVDMTVGTDGNITGSVGMAMLQLYPNNDRAPAPSTPGNVVQTWRCPAGGNVTVEVTADGKWMSMLGYATTTNRMQIRMNAKLGLGTGPAWEEMRNNPALLAVAAAVAGVRGEPVNADVPPLAQPASAR
jgi:hypothetical protein